MKSIFTVVLVLMVVITSAQTIAFDMAKQFAGESNSNEGLSVAQDPSGNIIIGGIMRGNVDFDPGPGSYVLNSFSAEDIFIAKLDPAGNFLWAKQIVANSWDEAHAVTTDASGNVYVTGRFATGTSVDFDPGPGTFLLTPSTTNLESFVLKLDPNGNFLWAKKIGGDGGDYGFGIGIDGNGDLLLAGSFEGTVNFDPGASDFTLSTAGPSAMYILKLTQSGSFIWARQVGRGDGSFCYGMTIDDANNIITSGYFQGTCDFDPGAPTFNLVSAGSVDMFISKIDADGDFVFGKAIGGFGNDAAYGALATDAAGNVFMATPFGGTLDIDPGPGVFNITSTSSSIDAMLVKLNPAGDFMWGRKYGGASSDEAFALATDANGNVYVGGSCSGNIDFDPGPAEFFLNGGSGDGVVVKYDNNGSFLTAVRTIGNGGSLIYSMLINPSSQLLMTGYFSGTADFDPGSAVSNMAACCGSNIFITRFNLAGILPLTLLDFSGTAGVHDNRLSWSTGQEMNTKVFEIEWGSDGSTFKKIAELSASGNSSQKTDYNYTHGDPADGYNYYRLKMVDLDGRFTYSPVLRLSRVSAGSGIKVFPNPVTGVLDLQIRSAQKEILSLSLYSVEGRRVMTRQFEMVKGANKVQWDLRSLSPGSYFIRADNNLFSPVKVLKL